MTGERLVPDEPLPPYAYVSGRHPHPVSDPAGHSYGKLEVTPAPPDPERWATCRPYLVGLDRFNHGYYWEAHEAWEGLWHACGRTGPTADFLKGLIHLAAAGFKQLEGRHDGVRSHARRAAELLRQTSQRLAVSRHFGLDVARLAEQAEGLLANPTTRLTITLIEAPPG
jgi:uncharacterized protein